ncbi:hypothetical protein [Streptomyces sp. NBC_00344]|uniref:hypothetical protein n=1 Tax=Streptomyces sp. NBC_00344 TaxID=2975720 RepID=UPI002E23A5DE
MTDLLPTGRSDAHGQNDMVAQNLRGADKNAKKLRAEIRVQGVRAGFGALPDGR